METDPPIPDEPEDVQDETPEVRGQPGEIDDKLFDSVELRSTDPCPCSPPEPEDPDWSGILIRAPKRVVFKPGETVGEENAFARIPVCGFYQFPAAGEPASGGGEMRFVAVHEVTKKTYSGPVFQKRPGETDPPPDTPPIDPKELEGMVTASYFNMDLAENVPLPAEAARYKVHVEAGRHRSNEVAIEIVREPTSKP